MTPTEIGRELLCGLIALEEGFISGALLRASVHAWCSSPESSLLQIMVRLGGLTEAQERRILERVRECAPGQATDPHGFALATAAEGDLTVDDGGSRDLGLTGDVSAGRDLRELPTLFLASSSEARAFRAELGVGERRRFYVLRTHAEGGLGVISIALDTELHREVALKEIRSERAHESRSRARFLLEAEVTGQLEHPSIVPVYSLGFDEQGRPFYAMRFIGGESLLEAIKRLHERASARPNGRRRRVMRLELRQLLERFVTVCLAVEYAHKRGVVHRDIKPSNILLGQYGETLLMDWGLAKVLEESSSLEVIRVDDSSLAEHVHDGKCEDETLPGAVLGTPGFMSPEQAEGRSQDVGPTSDVYSLGATLYTLICGCTPFGTGGFEEIRRRTMQGTFPAPRKVKRGIPKALNAVVLKAMALRPKDRYLSARALGEDVRRWLADETVTAWAEPFWTPMIRWLTTHRVKVTAVAAAGLVGLLSLLAFSLFQASKNKELRRSNEQLREERQRVYLQFDIALRAVQELLREANSLGTNEPIPPEGFRKQMLMTARDYYEQLLPALRNDPVPRSQLALAQVSREIGLITSLVDNKQSAIEPVQTALTIYHRLLARDPYNPLYRKLISETLAQLSQLWIQLGSTDEAIGAMERALRISKVMLEDRPEDLESLSWQAELLNSMARMHGQLAWGGSVIAEHEAAIALADRVVKADPGSKLYRSRLASYHAHRADACIVVGDFEKARSSLEVSLGIRSQLAVELPQDRRSKQLLAASLHKLGVYHRARAEYELALAYFERALRLHRELAAIDPSQMDAQNSLASDLVNLGFVRARLGGQEMARSHLEEALKILTPLVEENPNAVAFRVNLAMAWHNLGDQNWASGDTSSGLDCFDRAVRITEESVERAPSIRQVRRVFVMHLMRRAAIRNACERSEGARQDALRALELLRMLREGGGEQPPDLAQFLLRVEVELCKANIHTQRYDEALSALKQARATRPLLADAVVPEDARMIELECMLASLSERDGRPVSLETGAALVESALAHLEEMVAQGYRDTDWIDGNRHLDVLRSHRRYGPLRADLGFPAQPFAR